MSEKNDNSGNSHVEPMGLERMPLPQSVQEHSPTEQVLNSWIAMEVLSPVTFRQPENLCDGDPKNVIKFSDRWGSLPWEDGVDRYRKFIIKSSSVLSP